MGRKGKDLRSFSLVSQWEALLWSPRHALVTVPSSGERAQALAEARQVSPQQSVTQRVWPRREMLGQKGMGKRCDHAGGTGCSSAAEIPVAVAAGSFVMFLYPKVGEKNNQPF